MKKTLLIALGIAILAIIAYGVSKNKPVEVRDNTTIKIGAVLGLTGSAATDSLNVKRGLDLAQEDLAVKGIKVEINYQDGKDDPKETISALQFLIATDRPQAIVGPIWGYLEDAAGPVIATNKIVAYAPADTSEFVSARSPYNFRGAPRNALIEQPTADWLKANKKTRVAIVVSNDGWGKSVAAPFRAAAKNAGASVVVDEAIQPFSANAGTIVASILTKAKNEKVDVILWTGYEPDVVALAKKRIQFGLVDVPVIDSGTIWSSLLSRGAISTAETKNVYFIAVPTTPEFIAKFKAKYGEEPSSYADRAYDGLMILVDAIQKAPAKDGDSIAKYMRENTHYQGYGGLYEFNENGDVKGGEWMIKPVAE